MGTITYTRLIPCGEQSSVKRLFSFQKHEVYEVVWDVEPCSLIGVDRRFRSEYCLRRHSFIALMIEAVRTSETSVHSIETTRRYIEEDSYCILAAVRT
jgi:hypothetical protein